jgi:hypothetical protein
MARNRRFHAVLRIDIDIVPLAVTVEPASRIFQLLNEFAAIQTWTSISLVRIVSEGMATSSSSII